MANPSNPQIELAFDYIQNTDKNIFLTGKAGTGKTTFLHRVREECFKRSVVVAPTGVAAINAKGMTIHSCFQLPFGPFVPGSKSDLSRQRKFSKKKVNLIRSIDLLIIDEISMVRADLLDSIDDVLKRFRDRNKPFGGVQLLMIGDLHQLPPVVKPHDWNMLREHYDTPYFFGSKALRASNPISIELKHIYRQSDTIFIDLLNRVRNNQLDQKVLDTLNSRYVPNFDPGEDEGYITLSSHNATAQSINDEKLKTLKTKSHKFKASIDGDFPEHAYPTELVLEFKMGAQVMFIKNDIGEEDRRYYNGKIGKIVGFDEDNILVKCPGDEKNISVVVADWDNVKYALDEKTKEVKEEVVGTFSQYPLKLAWAITIHKSQGLTFERAIIDAAAAFAHGQVYVALSRCRSFEGIVLRSKIGYGGVKTDVAVKDYSEQSEKNAPDEKHLAEAKKNYEQKLILELFDFEKTVWAFKGATRVFMENEKALSTESLNEVQEIYGKAEAELIAVSTKFKQWLEYEFYHTEGLPLENEKISERIKKASVYYFAKLQKEIMPAVKSISVTTDNASVGEKATEKLKEIRRQLFVKKACFAVSSLGFSSKEYVKTIADAEVDFDKSKGRASRGKGKPSSTVPKDILHPKLYTQLVEWRTALAEKEGLSSYEILPYSAIRSIVKFLPTTTKSFKMIEGFGDKKMKKYGIKISEMIQKYCDGLGIKTDLSVAEAAIQAQSKPKKKDTKKVSLEMFQAGKTIAEIAKDRGFVQTTIEGHLSHFIATGEVDIFKIIDREKVKEMTAYFLKNKPESLTVAKTHFGEKYSYGELRMALKYWTSIEAE